MAKLNIKIANPIINYFKEVKEVNTSCESIFSFTIQSTPGADIELAVTPARYPLGTIPVEVKAVTINLGAEDISVPFSTNDVANYPYITGTHIYRKVVKLNNTGKAVVKITMPNSGLEGYYPKSTVYIKDVTNNKEVLRSFNRYNDSAKCSTGQAPLASPDTFTVIKGSTNNYLAIGLNDDIKSVLYSTEVIITQQPTKGTLIIDPPNNLSPKVLYDHTTNDLTADSFKYKLKNNHGESAEALVNINVQSATKSITPTTKLVIGFDNSGSMATTFAPLDSAVNNQLKTTLTSHYGSAAAYDANVSIINIGKDERFLKFMHEKRNLNANTVVLIFMNEAVENYETITSAYEGSQNDPLRPLYKEDIDNLHFVLNNYAYQYDALIFQVNLIDDETQELHYHFKDWLTWVKKGQGSYHGKNGLSQKSNINLFTDVLEGNQVGATSQYYHDIIINQLNSLGFNL